MFDRHQRGAYNFQYMSVNLLVLIEMKVFAIPYNMNANEFKTLVCICVFPYVHEDASKLRDQCINNDFYSILVTIYFRKKESN